MHNRAGPATTSTGLIHHSDRGVQYLSVRYSERLADNDIVASVGSKGDSYDNAMIEASTGSTSGSSSTRRAPGTASRTSSSPPSTTSTGSTTDASTARSTRPPGYTTPAAFEADYNSQTSPAATGGDPINRASTKPGAIHRLEYAEDDVGKFHVDVVPSRPDPSGAAPLQVPRRDNGWHGSAPAEYTAWCTRLGPRYARTIRCLKRWRDEHQSVRTAIKSILLQVLAAQSMPDIEDEDVRLAETIRGMARSLRDFDAPPIVSNPVMPEEDLASRWTKEAFSEFKEELAEAEAFADKALAAENLAEACNHWRDVLGEEFPVPDKGDFGIRLSDTSHMTTPESRGWRREIRPECDLRIDATIQRGKRSPRRKRLSNDGSLIFAGNKLRFWAAGNVPESADIWWQVVNTGGHARDVNGLRGNMFRGKNLGGSPTSDERENWEDTAYTGSHLIRALAVDNGTVIAETDWFTVNIFATGHPFRM